MLFLLVHPYGNKEAGSDHFWYPSTLFFTHARPTGSVEREEERRKKGQVEDFLTQSGRWSSGLVPIKQQLWKPTLKGCASPLIGHRISPFPLAGVTLDCLNSAGDVKPLKRVLHTSGVGDLPSGIAESC